MKKAIHTHNGIQGFTLMEILIAMTIVAVLMVIGIVSYSSINKRSRDAKRLSDIEQVRGALEMYRNDTGAYPGDSVSFIKLTDLVDGNGANLLVPDYLPAIPMDPKGTAAEPVSYYYAPMSGGITGPPYYYYCLCSVLETIPSSNTCDVNELPPLPVADDYCVRNP